MPQPGQSGATAIPIGVNPTSIGVPAGWWLAVAGLLEEAGFAAAWCWDHFISRGRKTDPVLECWTTLTAAAARTSRIRVGSFVTNVLARHPALLARTTATLHELSGGRVDVAVGAGGNPREHEAYGLEYPSPGERLDRLEEAVAVMRALWTGGPVDYEGRFYTLRGAHAFPAPHPAPRLLVAGEKPRSARLAGHIGDAWTTTIEGLERHRDDWLAGLEASGRQAADVGVVLELRLDRHADPARQPLLQDLVALAGEWSERGATEIVLGWIRPHDVPALLAAAERAELA